MRSFKLNSKIDENPTLIHESRWDELDFGGENPCFESLELVCPPTNRLLRSLCERITFLVNFDLSALSHGLLSQKLQDLLDARFPESLERSDENVVKWITESPRRIYDFIDRLLINDTAVFRPDISAFYSTQSWEYFLEKIIPILKENGEIRTWVIGASDLSECSSIGLLMELSECNFKIVATEIDSKALSDSEYNLNRRGIQAMMIGKIPRFIKEKFDLNHDIYPKIAKKVTLLRHDVLKDKPVSTNFNFVSMSNLLRHYNPWGQRACLMAIDRCIEPGGVLFVGECEEDAVQDILPNYVRIGKRFYQKPKADTNEEAL